jgi:xanthine dehydrogenase accessory factor
LPADQLARLKAPAGLDIGATAPEEIAVSILAEIVQVARRRAPDVPAAEPTALRDEVLRDPVCGMVVDPTTARHRSEVAGRLYYFCCAHCKDTFDRDPSRYVLRSST